MVLLQQEPNISRLKFFQSFHGNSLQFIPRNKTYQVSGEISTHCHAEFQSNPSNNLHILEQTLLLVSLFELHQPIYTRTCEISSCIRSHASFKASSTISQLQGWQWVGSCSGWVDYLGNRYKGKPQPIHLLIGLMINHGICILSRAEILSKSISPRRVK